VKDDDLREDHEFDNVEKDQLDEFERELADESKKKRRKLFLIAGGTAVCALAFLFFSGALDQMDLTNPMATLKASVPTASPKASTPTAPAAKATEEKPQAAKADPEMEAAQKKNIVEGDSKAPGVALEAGKPSTDKDPKKADKSKPSTETKVEQSAAKPRAGFVLQAVATSDAALAVSAREDLAVKGYKSWISIGKVKESVFVVEVGEFASAKDAAPQREKLEKAGFEPRVAQSGGKTALIAGVFLEKAGAEAVSARAKAAGFAPKVVNRKDSSDLYLVHVGPYGSADEAKKAGDAIKTAGYSPISVNQ
jgi:cell division protein FtsN